MALCLPGGLKVQMSLEAQTALELLPQGSGPEWGDCCWRAWLCVSHSAAQQCGRNWLQVGSARQLTSVPLLQGEVRRCHAASSWTRPCSHDPLPHVPTGQLRTGPRQPEAALWLHWPGIVSAPVRQHVSLGSALTAPAGGLSLPNPKLTERIGGRRACNGPPTVLINADE